MLLVTLKNAPNPYGEIAELEYDYGPLSSFAANVLTEFDRPDCSRVLENNERRRR